MPEVAGDLLSLSEIKKVAALAREVHNLEKTENEAENNYNERKAKMLYT